MAVHKGSEGVVKVGANTIAEVRSWSVEQSGDTLETTTMGDTARSYLPSLTSFSGSMDVYLDETDTTGQGALTIGAVVTINFYFEGETSGDTYYTGSVIVNSISRQASFDGLLEMSIGFQGDGALTTSTVV